MLCGLARGVLAFGLLALGFLALGLLALGGRLARVLRPLDGAVGGGARRPRGRKEITTPTNTTATTTTITATSDPLRIPHPLAE